MNPVASNAAPSEGALFYIVGTPAEAKHRLLEEARGELTGDHRVVFAHRYVAGRAGSGRSDEIELPEAEFLARVHHRLFAMHWESGGLQYGIGMEINYWLAIGLSVVVRGSRAYLPHAIAAYPEMIVLWIGADTGRTAPAGARRAQEQRQCHNGICAASRWTRRRSPVIYLDCNGAQTQARAELVSLLTAGPERA